MDPIGDIDQTAGSKEQETEALTRPSNSTTLAEPSKDDTRESATTRALAIYELREAILVQYAVQDQVQLHALTADPEYDPEYDMWLDPDLCKEIAGPALGLYVLQRVNRTFFDTISRSSLLQETMCRQPGLNNISTLRWFFQTLGMGMTFLGGSEYCHEIKGTRRNWWESGEEELRYQEVYIVKTNFSPSTLAGDLLPEEWKYEEEWTSDDERTYQEECTSERESPFEERRRPEFRDATWKTMSVFNATEPMMRSHDADEDFHQLTRLAMVLNMDDIPLDMAGSMILDLEDHPTLRDVYLQPILFEMAAEMMSRKRRNLCRSCSQNLNAFGCRGV